MDPLTVIITALIAGAAAGGQDAVSAAVRDTYSVLRNRLTRGSDPGAVAVIETNETAPGSSIDELEDMLRRARAAEDRELRSDAEALLSQLPTGRVDDARSRIDLRHAQGVQIGDHGVQHNSFG
ncbi:hypothetical protein [Nocardia sp. NBC_00416]|uniref:hypothetical protein n=1 Tax=Nocardia sp. NBC_00416 TaxID=2975991 RepID=UPI002E2181C5